MKKSLIFLLCISMSLPTIMAKKKASFMSSLSKIPGVTSVRQIQSEKFKERYILTFRQYIDHNDTSLGTFSQRIIVGNVNEDSTTVVVTEGYSAAYTEKPSYREELSSILNANSVIIEHRYFNESVPDIKDRESYWEHLTTYNAATDHHRIVEAFKTIYKGKFIATGVSKGGICANLYRMYYPKDVDITVPYVAPLCNGVEDKRMAIMVGNYAKKGKRQDEGMMMRNFMEYLFQNRNQYLKLLDNYISENNLECRISLEELFDLTVLDMRVALLARGEVKRIPEWDKAPIDSIFKFVAKYGSPEGFTPTYDNMPYYVQAARELGHYAYDDNEFGNLLSIKSTTDYLRRTALPDEMQCKYDPETHHRAMDFLNSTDAHMLFIYGEYDPWTSVGIKDLVNNPNIYIFINPGNCHRSKINNFPKEMKEKIIDILHSWLREKQ